MKCLKFSNKKYIIYHHDFCYLTLQIMMREKTQQLTSFAYFCYILRPMTTYSLYQLFICFIGHHFVYQQEEDCLQSIIYYFK